MKRLAWLVVAIGLAVLAPVQRAGAQESAAPKTGEAGVPEEKEPAEVWKWANFLLLVGGLGYLVSKHAPAFFAARSQKIVQDITDSRKLREDAEARAADVDRRLANLEADIASMRSESQAEIAAETERLGKHTAAEISKIESHAKQEIDTAGKAARMDLKRYAAQLAIDLAERKIRARLTPETQDGLVRGFVRDLRKPPSESQRN
jgi:F-type H+-transporting ATPase subunit b